MTESERGGFNRRQRVLETAARDRFLRVPLNTPNKQCDVETLIWISLLSPTVTQACAQTSPKEIRSVSCGGSFNPSVQYNQRNNQAGEQYTMLHFHFSCYSWECFQSNEGIKKVKHFLRCESSRMEAESDKLNSVKCLNINSLQW